MKPGPSRFSPLFSDLGGDALNLALLGGPVGGILRC
jgi:hypothetical protein